jgi:ribokinase
MVLGIGSVVVDRTFVVSEMPQWDRVTHSKEYQVGQGGMVATALAASAKMGVPSEFIGVFGDDDGGELIRHSFDHFGIKYDRAIIARGQYSPVSICLVNEQTGSRSIVHNRMSYDERAFDSEIDLTGITHLHLDGYWPRSALDVATAAREKGITVTLDPSSTLLASPYFDPILDVIDFLIPGEVIAGKMSGESVPEKMLETLYRPNMKAVIITFGEKGCFIFDGKEHDHVAAFKIKVVDTTGAGDVFHGAFVAAHSWGFSVNKACEFASAAAGLKCQKVGGQAGICTRKEVDDFIIKSGREWL